MFYKYRRNKTMKAHGRPYVPLTEQEKLIVLEYLETDKGLQEVAEKYGYTKNWLRYKVVKYRRECDTNGEKNHK